MTKEKFAETILFAIQQEKEAAEFYRNLAIMAKKESSKTMIKEFEDMEIEHMRILMDLKGSELDNYTPPNIPNLKISDYLEDVEVADDLDFQQVLTIAMKKEEAAKNLYKDLADNAEDDKLKNLFMKLADEEAKHKLQLESIFDDEIFAEN